MAYNPELVKAFIGDKVAELMDGTIEINKSELDLFYGNLKAGDTLTFKFKDDGNFKPRQFIVAGK